MRVTALLLAAMLVIALAGSVGAQVREQRPNLIGGEVLGRGLILTLNYERFLSNSFGLGAGIMAIGTSDGAGILLPLYMSFATGDIHSFYASAGTTYAGGGDVGDYEDTWLMTIAAGYQYHSTSGFFVRPLFTLFLPTEGADDEYLVWPGVTIGGSF